MLAGSAARQCAHVKREKLARWPYVGGHTLVQTKATLKVVRTREKLIGTHYHYPSEKRSVLQL